jgi:hypothetical protein
VVRGEVNLLLLEGLCIQRHSLALIVALQFEFFTVIFKFKFNLGVSWHFRRGRTSIRQINVVDRLPSV